MTSPISRPPTSVVHKPLPHDSARLHVQGSATYVDDIREPAGTLHVAIGMADKALRQAEEPRSRARCAAAPGVVAVLTAADIPGKNDIAPVFADEPLFADRRGHVPRAGAVRRRRRARATRRAGPRGSPRSTSRREPPSVTIADALDDRRSACRTTTPSAAATRPPRSTRPPHRLEGQLSIGGQEHFYLEGQASFAIPGEGDEMTVHASTPGPDRDAAHRRARSRRSGRLRHRRDAPDGRRLRRQGEPGLHLGGDRRARRARHRPAVQDSPRSRRRFHADRQAPRFPRRLAGRLRRQGRRRRLRRDAQRPLRLLGRPVARRRATARCSTPATATGCPTSSIAHPPPQDQHRLQHRLSRLRRPAGHDRDRAGDGRDRARARPRSARRAQGQSAARRLRPHALRPDGRGLRDPAGDHRGARGVERLSRAPRSASPPSTRRARSSSAASR